MSNHPGLPDSPATVLPNLLHDVEEARTLVDEERSRRSAFYPRTVTARLALLTALEAYTDALTATGWPLPYRLRDELFLYRRLTGAVRWPRPD